MRLDIDVFGDVQFSRELLRVGERAGDMSPVFEELAEDFREMQEEQFNSQGKFSGGWAPLAPSTLDRKLALGQDPRILHATLALRRSLTQLGAPGAIRRITPDELVLGTDVKSKDGFPYPAAHQNPKQGQTRRRIIEFDPMRKTDWVKRIQRHIVESGSLAGRYSA